ncbi:MAG: MFS transporter [Burkholderiaceae bacterium]|nr:MFS transporter [Burkholderiaceae bacterium]
MHRNTAMQARERSGHTVADACPLLVAGLVAAVATVGATIFAISPLLPDIAASFGVAPARAGWLIGAYGLSMAIVAPTVGLLARRLPRARVIVAGLLLFALVWLLAAATRRFDALLGLTLLAGAATGAVIPATYAYAGDLSSFAHRGQVMGRIVSGWSIAILLVVPAMAIASQAIDWQAAFAGLAVAALLAAAVLALAPRPAATADAEAAAELPVGPSLRRVLSHRPTLFVLAVNGIDMGAFYAVYAFLGNEIRRVNDWGAAPVGFAIAAYGAGLLIVTLNGRLIDRIGKTRSAIAALAALGALLSGLPWLVGAPALLVVAIVAWGCTQGVFFTAITSLATEQIPELRGVVTAMLSGATYLGVTLFSPLAVLLYERAGYPAVGALAGLASLAGAALLAGPGAQVASVERR